LKYVVLPFRASKNPLHYKAYTLQDGAGFLMSFLT